MVGIILSSIVTELEHEDPLTRMLIYAGYHITLKSKIRAVYLKAVHCIKVIGSLRSHIQILILLKFF